MHCSIGYQPSVTAAIVGFLATVALEQHAKVSLDVLSMRAVL